MNSGTKVSILFFLILMMIALPLALSLLPSQAGVPQAISGETIQTIAQYRQRANLALSMTGENAPSSMKRAIIGTVAAGPRRPS